MSHAPDVAIGGGGIIGLTAAYFLARAGAEVVVYDRGDLGKEASWAGAGILPPGNPERAATPVDVLRGIGAQQFPDFSSELLALTGIDNGYRRSGAIEFLSAEHNAVPRIWAAEGIRFERMTNQSARELESFGTIDGVAYFLPDCAQVRNPWHMRALIAAVERIGVRLHPHTPIAGWRSDGGRLLCATSARGDRIHARQFLLTGGAWSSELLQPLGYRIPVHPVRGQIALLRGPSCSHIVLFGKRYLVPRGDGLTLVGSTEEPEAGYEKQTTTAGIRGLLEFARGILPLLEQATLESSWAGLRPGSPDGIPFIGAIPGWENAFVATGHFRSGVQLSIGTARMVMDLLSGVAPVFPHAAFALERIPALPCEQAFRS
jgi:glycine oxidase